MLKRIQTLVHSPALGFWSFVLTGFSIWAIYNIYFLEKEVKSLQVSYSLSSVVAIQQDLQSKIDMAYEGVPFEDIAIIDYKVENVGTVPILKSDFIQPLTFAMNSDWFMIGGNWAIPPGSSLDMDVPASPALTDNPQIPAISQFSITPDLLNQGDGWEGKLVVITRKAGSPVDFRVGSHIIGIPEIQTVDLSKTSVSQDILEKRNISIGMVLGILISIAVWSSSTFVSYAKNLLIGKRVPNPIESSNNDAAEHSVQRTAGGPRQKSKSSSKKSTVKSVDSSRRR